MQPDRKTDIRQFYAPLTEEALKEVDRFIFPAINKVREEATERADDLGFLRELNLVLNAACAVPALANEVRRARCAATQPAPAPLLGVVPAPTSVEVEAIKEMVSSLATVRGSREEVATVRAYLARLAAAPASQLLGGTPGPGRRIPVGLEAALAVLKADAYGDKSGISDEDRAELRHDRNSTIKLLEAELAFPPAEWAAPSTIGAGGGDAERMTSLEAENERLKALYEKHKPFEPSWVYLRSGELPPLNYGSWGPNGNFMSRDLLLTIQTPGHIWVVKGRRNLNCKNGWDCNEAELFPDVRTITAWAYPDPRLPEDIKPAARIDLAAAPTQTKEATDEAR
jgi:hypothetical protein